MSYSTEGPIWAAAGVGAAPTGPVWAAAGLGDGYTPPDTYGVFGPEYGRWSQPISGLGGDVSAVYNLRGLIPLVAAIGAGYFVGGVKGAIGVPVAVSGAGMALLSLAFARPCAGSGDMLCGAGAKGYALGAACAAVSLWGAHFAYAGFKEKHA